jgi:predicted nucleotidyltransferase
MALREELQHHRDALHQIAARHGASNLRLFGSVARGEERPDSDIDLLIDLADNRGFGDYLALAERSKPCFIARSILCWSAASVRISVPISRPTPSPYEIRSALSGACLSSGLTRGSPTPLPRSMPMSSEAARPSCASG